MRERVKKTKGRCVYITERAEQRGGREGAFERLLRRKTTRRATTETTTATNAKERLGKKKSGRPRRNGEKRRQRRVANNRERVSPLVAPVNQSIDRLDPAHRCVGRASVGQTMAPSSKLLKRPLGKKPICPEMKTAYTLISILLLSLSVARAPGRPWRRDAAPGVQLWVNYQTIVLSEIVRDPSFSAQRDTNCIDNESPRGTRCKNGRAFIKEPRDYISRSDERFRSNFAGPTKVGSYYSLFKYGRRGEALFSRNYERSEINGLLTGMSFEIRDDRKWIITEDEGGFME